MKKLTRSDRTYFALIVVLTLMASLNVFLPQGDFLPIDSLPISRSLLALINGATMLILYGSLGYLGLRLSQKVGFANIWDDHVNNKQRFIIPMLIGIGCGLFLIVADLVFSQFHQLGTLPHPPFPTSLVASIIAGIGEELIFRLFFISFWVWLIFSVILKNKWKNQIFWVIATISALAFAAGHIPSALIILGIDSIEQLPISILVEIFVLNSVVALVAAFYFRKYGFLAAVGIHFWTDVIWHVIYGSFS